MITEITSMPPRYRSLDMWRGIACLMVVLFHSSFYLIELEPYRSDPSFLGRLVLFLLYQGQLGVPLFFVISGYCIAASCDPTHHKELSVVNFWQRRLKRIYFPYWVSLACYLVLFLLFTVTGYEYVSHDDLRPIPALSELSIGQWIGNVTLTETWLMHVHSNLRSWTFFIGQAWTLSYEEQFYFVCGLLLLIGKRFFPLVLGLTLFVLCVSAVFFFTQNMFEVRGVFYDGAWLTFVLGVAVYFRINYLSTPEKSLVRRLFDWSLIVLVVLVCAFRMSQFCFDYEQRHIEEYIVASAFAYLLIKLYTYDLKLSQKAWIQPLFALGTISYSVYLIHWPLVKLISHLLFLVGVRGIWFTLSVTLPLCTFTSLILAQIFYELVEKRCQSKRPVPEKYALKSSPKLS